jgi:hypothetical protein
MYLIGGDNAPYCQGYEPYQSPTATATSYVIKNGGIFENFVINECKVNGISGSYSVSYNDIYCSQPVVNLINLSPQICDITNYPNVVSIETGQAGLLITTAKDSLLLKIDCFVKTVPPVPNYVYEYEENSLAKVMSDLIINAVGNRTTPEPSFMNLYSSGSTPNQNLYTKNIIDISPFTDNGYASGTCLISPRHILFATHTAPLVNSYITFTRADGTTTTKQIIYVGRDVGGVGTDVGVGYLDSAVEGITPYSVLPQYDICKTKIPLGTNPIEYNDIYGTLPIGIYGFYAKKRYPFGGGDNIRQMQLGNYSQIVGNPTSSPPRAAVITPPFNKGTITNINDIRYAYNLWSTTVAQGDSGAPGFLPTGLKTTTKTPLTILLGQTLLGVASISYCIPQVNAGMNAMKSPSDTTIYALDVANTSTKLCYTQDGFATTLSTWWNSFNSY